MSELSCNCVAPRSMPQHRIITPWERSRMFEAEKTSYDLHEKAKETGKTGDFLKAVGYDAVIKPLYYPSEYYIMRPPVIY